MRLGTLIRRRGTRSRELLDVIEQLSKPQAFGGVVLARLAYHVSQVVDQFGHAVFGGLVYVPAHRRAVAVLDQESSCDAVARCPLSLVVGAFAGSAQRLLNRQSGEEMRLEGVGSGRVLRGVAVAGTHRSSPSREMRAMPAGGQPAERYEGGMALSSRKRLKPPPITTISRPADPPSVTGRRCVSWIRVAATTHSIGQG
jgi:hypothetical protein